MTTYRMDIGGLICDIDADLTQASAPVYCTLISTIPTSEQRRHLIGQTADARHRESGLRDLAEAHLRAEGVLIDPEA